MTLAAYFDESEHRQGNEPIAVAGFLFKPVAYQKFCRSWRRCVLRYQQRQLAHFHMTDLCAGEEEYEGLSISERIEILGHAVDAIAAHGYAAVGVHFDQVEFEQVAPVEWPSVFGSVYTAACHMCVQGTAYGLCQWGCPLNVRYVFESGHKFQPEVDRLMTSINHNDAARKEFRYSTHAFEEKGAACGLQAADLLAFAITKGSLGGATRSQRPFMPAMQRLAPLLNKRQAIFPLTGERLVTFLQDQMEGMRSLERAVPVDFGPRKRRLR